MVASAPKDKVFDVDLSNIASREKWYHYSWKGDDMKSGGIATNIALHFFDMLHFVFGSLKTNDIHIRDASRTGGYLEFARACVRWFLSVDATDLPDADTRKNLRTNPSITVDNEEIEFSGGFDDLHTHVYEDILCGGGYRPPDYRGRPRNSP